MSADRFRPELLPDPLDFYEAQGLVLTGKGKWRGTSCTFHGGSDSMRINTGSGGFICMNCGQKGGDVVAYLMAANEFDFVTTVQLLGAWVDDPNGAPAPDSTKPRRMPASDAIQVLDTEANLAAVAAGNVAQGVPLTDADRTRLMLAANRIHRITEIFS
jgi:CHC2 zinc finger